MGLFLILIHLNVAASPAAGDLNIINQAWYIKAIQLDKAWDLVEETPDVKIAVIDMDFNLNDEDLKNSFDLDLSKDFSGHNFLKMTLAAEASQHGTLVSSLIAADGYNSYGSTGVIKKAKIIAINIAPVGDEKIDIEEVIRYAVDSGAKVINGSFGYIKAPEAIVKKMRSAIQYAREKDVLLVFSAGNFGDDIDKQPFYPASFTTEFDNVISVGGSNSEDKIYVSNYGKVNVDLMAPGANIIISHLPGKFKLSHGTSEASPIVAAVVALMRQSNPKLKAPQIKKIILESTDKVSTLKNLSVTSGRLNAFKAISTAITTNGQ